jgi:hypothetical protein
MIEIWHLDSTLESEIQRRTGRMGLYRLVVRSPSIVRFAENYTIISIRLSYKGKEDLLCNTLACAMYVSHAHCNDLPSIKSKTTLFGNSCRS